MTTRSKNCTVIFAFEILEMAIAFFITCSGFAHPHREAWASR